MSFAKPIFTTRGKQIELQGIEGKQIIFSKIKLGDGRITTQSPSQLTDLINVIAEAPITSLKRYDAYAAIRSVFQNTDVQEAFWWREVGLFAIDPATKEEVLYAYQNAYDTAEYITPSSLVTKKINWTIYIDDGENLGADIHKKMVFCSVEDLDEHNDLESAHEAAFAQHNADENAHEVRFSKYVPLSGGAMTETMAMCRNTDDSDIQICGGKTADKGAYLQAYGADNSSNGGSFLLVASKDGIKKELLGTPKGQLIWDSKNIIRSIDGKGADESGNIMSRNYLQRSTTYAKGDIAFHDSLPSWAYLECTQAGTTSDNELNAGSAQEKEIITDGTTQWEVKRFGGSSGGTPVGTIIMYAANTIPDGYLLCDGSAVSRTDYAELFKVIGTTWGTGNGSTTFNLPNAVGRFPMGSSSVGSYKNAGLPALTGAAAYYGFCNSSSATAKIGALSAHAPKLHATFDISGSGTKFYTYTLDFDASWKNAIYGKATTVQPPAMTIKYLIKY